jgi:hypothetical protein
LPPLTGVRCREKPEPVQSPAKRNEASFPAESPLSSTDEAGRNLRAKNGSTASSR